ncbi:class I adenylate-forming enzyme family protein [Streptomyces sp. NPDC020412]|uniref:class I adenylate-forming enzyme family protein n=1 Tax=Streptomyces sp. NPDC020412 TaxID=3365073 RepID=UPI003789096E
MGEGWAVGEGLTGGGAPFEVERGEGGGLAYVGGVRTLTEFVEATWGYGDRVFLVGEGRAYTYREFFAAASALARRLVDGYGVRSGERVGIVMRNHPEWVIGFWGVQLAGLVAVPLNAWWTEGELAYALDDCEPAVLLVDGERLGSVQAWAGARGARVVVFHGDGGGAESAGARIERYEDWEAPDPYGAPPAVDVRGEDDATIIYTSGTTGRPKGAVATQLAQVGAAAHARYQAAAATLARGGVPGAGAAPVALMTFPLFHVAAFTTLFPVMATGGTLVLMRKWDAVQAVRLIDEHRVSHFSGVPTTALELLDAAGRAGGGLASLTNLSTGGAAAPPELVARLTARYGTRIEPRTGYGLTETSGGVLASFGDAYRADPLGVGLPAPAVEVRIDEGGELLLRGQSLVRGYWRDPEATAAAFTPDGWLRTGDLAVEVDGRIRIVDRIKDVVIRGGENVYGVEVEAVLHEHPAVADAAVVGVPHPVLGEEVAAVVQVRAGAAVTGEEVREHVRGRLAAFKVPAHVVFGEVPRSLTGKILKRELRGAVHRQVRGG